MTNRINFNKPAPSCGGEFDPATSVTLKMVLDQDEHDAGNTAYPRMHTFNFLNVGGEKPVL